MNTKELFKEDMKDKIEDIKKIERRNQEIVKEFWQT